MLNGMTNKIISFFHFGNNEQSIIINNSEINASLKRIEKDFFEGNIHHAMEFLFSLIDENEGNRKVKYQLLVKKSSFLFSLRKYDEAIKLVENIEKNYTEFIDVSFEKIKLIGLSLNRREEDFFALADKIILESNNELKKVSFELMYYLNFGDLEKAKIIFDSLADKEKASKEFCIVGGHIYANILEGYKEADIYYQIALSHQISFLEKSIIFGFYGTNIINKYMYGQNLSDKYKDTLITYQKIIYQIIENEKYFESSYLLSLKDIYLALLLVIGNREEYIEFYEKESDHAYIWSQHYLQYVNIKNIPIEHKKVQDEVLTNNSERLLLTYVSIIDKKNQNAKEVINFLDKNLDLVYKNRYILFYYVQGKLFFANDLSRELLEYLESHKYDNIEYIISYIRIHLNSSKKVGSDDINKLLELAGKEKTIAARTIETLYLLKKLGKRKEYLNLAIEKGNEFSLVIEKTFSLIYQDRDLLLKDFEEFISKVDVDKYAGFIADIYNIYERYNLSFSYYYKLFSVEKERDRKIEISMNILEVSRKFYERHQGRVNNIYEDEIIKYLLANRNNIDLNDVIHISYYLLTIDKNIALFLELINASLLSVDIQSLSHEIKLNLSALYFNLISNYPELKTENINKNTVYLKDGVSFINIGQYSNINSKNIKSYSLEYKSVTSWNKLAYDNRYERKSLFHILLGYFVYSLENPNIEKMEIHSEDGDFVKLNETLRSIGKKDKEKIDYYSNGGYIPFYILAKKEYRRYFSLIPELLENKDIVFDAGKPYFQTNKKILTLSSLILVDYLGYLEKILDRDDVFIQQTLLNWLMVLVDELEKKDSEFSLGSDGEKLYKYENSKEDLERSVKKISVLINNINDTKIIDDTTVGLPIREAGKILNDSIGTQELQAIAYCMEHDYQIISEDRMFIGVFESFKLNQTMVSNSIAILRDTLSTKEIINAERRLHSKKYKSLLHCLDEEKLFGYLNYPNIQSIISENILQWFGIMYDYGCLDSIISIYRHEYKVLYPKSIIPVKDDFSSNMEYLLEILDASEKL